jgi:hypothetical protein
MDYQKHRNHTADGTDPWPGCQFCEQFIVQPAIREMGNAYPALTGRASIDLDELAVDEAA